MQAITIRLLGATEALLPNAEDGTTYGNTAALVVKPAALFKNWRRLTSLAFIIKTFTSHG
jgi:hypothetical protein